VNFRILVLASGTFAIGTGTFVVTGILGEVARDLSVSVGSAGYLITVFAVVYALGSPVLVVATGDVERRRLLVAALCLFALANGAAAFAPSFFWLLGLEFLPLVEPRYSLQWQLQWRQSSPHRGTRAGRSR
jgi:MFS transporter, DHA1 family, inner membrane transport protein